MLVDTELARVDARMGTRLGVRSGEPPERALARMAVQRTTHASLALDDGRVLVAGGRGTGCTTAEPYDPGPRTFALTGVTQYPHPSVSLGARLTSGKVLLTGGDGGSFSPPVAEP